MMLEVGASSQLFAAYGEDVVAPETKDAYAFLVGWGVASRSYSCAPGTHGRIKDVRYMFDGAQYFAFIPNQRWLLFYFRKPCLGLPKYSQQRLAQHFPALNETPGGEFTVRITSIEDALRVARYIEN